MAIRKVPLVDHEYYHIYNRGNSKQKIFLDDQDYRHFVTCLYIFNSYKKFKIRDISMLKISPFDFDRGQTLVSIGAWKLMPNHFHIYLTSHKSDLCKEDRNAISEFMRKILTAYSKYFNLKYQRTGSLFEGKFKSVHINDDIQAKYLFSYIHLNCIKLIYPKWKENGILDISKALDYLGAYKWSSYLDYKGIMRPENKILNRDTFPKYFSSISDFDKEILEWLNGKGSTQVGLV